jgi:hypothetical protein
MHLEHIHAARSSDGVLSILERGPPAGPNLRYDDPLSIINLSLILLKFLFLTVSNIAYITNSVRNEFLTC